MDQEQAEIIKILAEAPTEHRNPYYVMAKLNKSFTSTYIQLRVMAEVGYIKINKSRISKKSFYSPSEIGVKQANEVLKSVS